VDLPLAVSVVVVLQLVNIIAVPLWAGQVITGASISAWQIVKSLLLLVLLPLVAGLFIRARYADRSTSAPRSPSRWSTSFCPSLWQWRSVIGARAPDRVAYNVAASWGAAGAFAGGGTSSAAM
jgi:SBF-like CPA transporter family (DUF4137)